MQYHASYTDGTTDTGIVDPASLAEQKRQAIAAILDPDCTMYRMRITDPACFGEWDSDYVLGITPKDRDAAGDDGEADRSTWSPAARELLASDAACPSDTLNWGDGASLPLPVEKSDYRAMLRETFPPVFPPPTDTESFLADAAAMYSATQAVIRQSEAASVLARCSRDLYDVLTKLDSDDDAAAYHAVQGEALTLASEASSLGWPLDGNGVPLRECRDECGV